MSRLGPPSQPCVISIPSTEGGPLRTFIFLTNGKGCVDEYDLQIYFADEWWCAGGKSTDTWYFNRKCKELKPHQCNSSAPFSTPHNTPYESYAIPTSFLKPAAKTSPD